MGTTLGVVSVFFIIRKLIKKEANTMSKVDYSIFDSPDVKGSGNCISHRLVYKLKLLEARTGYPIFNWINSGVRTPYWNQKVGGVSNSSHKVPNCTAVDIKANTIEVRDTLVMVAKEIGFRRIGVGNTFVHLDVDPSKRQNIAWGYPSGNPPAINPFV